jgi:hypothetical protein
LVISMRARWAGIMVGALLLQASQAHAEDRAAAMTLFDQGVSAMEANDYPTACTKFRDSIAASPGLGAMLWLGECYEKNGQTASAWAQFRQATALAAEKSDPREKVARKRTADLEAKLSRLEIAVTSPVQNLEISRDGTPVASSALGTPIPVDPGTHVVKATAPGRRPFEQTVTVANGASARIAIPALEEATSGQDASSAAAGNDDPNRGRVQRIAGLAAGGVGVVLVGVGAVFGLSASSKLDESNADGRCRQPGDFCTPEGIALREEASDAATLSTVMFGLGAAAIIGGAALYLTAPRSNGTGVVLAPAGAGFTLVGAY